jgi:surface antigen
MARLCGLRALSILPIVLVAGSLAGGCSYQLGSVMSKDDKADTADITGSVPPKTPSHTADTATPPNGDLALAKAAALEVLGGDTSLPWENPQTGARGTVTPLADAYAQDGFTCRDFLASYVREGAESWLQGEACRMHQGKWEVKSLRPWKRI